MIAVRRCACVSGMTLLIAACAPLPPAPVESEFSAALGLINKSSLAAHVAVLSDDVMAGREAGEPGYDDAAAYVSAQLQKMGVTAAGTDGWYQAVPLRGYKVRGDEVELTVHGAGADETLVYRDDFSIEADAMRESTRVRGEVVYVGYGVHAPELGYSDYEGVDVRDKIVAVFRGAPDSLGSNEAAYYGSSRTKSQEAVSRGAIGSLSLRSVKAEERRAWSDSKDRIGKRERKTWFTEDGRAARHYPELRGGASLSIDAAKRVLAGSPLSFDAAHEAMLSNTPMSMPLGVSVTLAAASEHSSVMSANVVGMVRGTDPVLSNEYVVYTAHLDHVGVKQAGDSAEDEDRIRNGMYDNAMGVALMLETARAIAAAPLGRSVLFVAVTAEEYGLLGSDYFVNNPPVPVDSIVANINLDMPLFLYPVADLVAFGSQHSSLQSVVETSSQAEGFSFSPDPMPEERLFVRSDQYSFVRAGIPAVFLVTGFNSTDGEINGEQLFRDHLENHYHQASDDLTRPVDWDSAVRFARAHTRIGQTVANTRDRPSWNEGDFFGKRFASKVAEK